MGVKFHEGILKTKQHNIINLCCINLLNNFVLLNVANYKLRVPRICQLNTQIPNKKHLIALIK